MRRRTSRGARRRGRGGRRSSSASSVVWPGLDAQETPKVDTSVWALQTGDGRRYARVNTTVGELDTVRSISNPDKVVADRRRRLPLQRQPQQGHEDRRGAAGRPRRRGAPRLAVDARRHDRCRHRRRLRRLPDRLRRVFAGLLGGGPAAARPVPLRRRGRPAVHRGRHRRRRSRHPVQLLARRRLGAALRHPGARRSAGATRSTPKGSRRRRSPPRATPGRSSTPRTATCGCEGADAATTRATTGTVVVEQPDPDGSAVYLADETALVSVAVDGSAIDDRRRHRHACSARPRSRSSTTARSSPPGSPQGDDGGVLWSSSAGHVRLDYGGETLGDSAAPPSSRATTPSSSTRRARAGRGPCPDGALVPSSQDWTLDDRTDPDAVPSDEQLTVVIDPKPPIAEPDAFGVRAGEPREPAGAHERPRPERGRAEHRPRVGHRARPRLRHRLDHRRRPAHSRCGSLPARAGSATFSYAVSDGTAEGGLLSEPTTVTLTVAPDARDSAPEWCGVERLPRRWPDARGRPRRHGHGSGAAGLGRPRGRPAAAARRRQPVRRRQRRRRPRAATSSTSTATTAAAARSSSSSPSRSPTPRGRSSRSRCWCGCRRSRSWTVQSFAVIDTVDAGDHRGCRAARDRNAGDDVARLGARARRRRGHAPRSSAARRPSTSRPARRARSGSTSPSPTG